MPAVRILEPRKQHGHSAEICTGAWPALTYWECLSGSVTQPWEALVMKSFPFFLRQPVFSAPIGIDMGQRIPTLVICNTLSWRFIPKWADSNSKHHTAKLYMRLRLISSKLTHMAWPYHPAATIECHKLKAYERSPRLLAVGSRDCVVSPALQAALSSLSSLFWSVRPWLRGVESCIKGFYRNSHLCK